MEIKTLDVANSEENETIEFWSQFGWVLKSSQRVYNQDSHLENRGGSTYSVTNTVDFTKLVFERDKNGPNYERIAELERMYFYYNDMLPNKKPIVYDSAIDFAQATHPSLTSGFTAALPIILRVLGIVMFAGGAVLGAGNIVSNSIAVPMAMLGIPVFVFSFIIKGILELAAFKKALRGEGAPAEELKKKFQQYSERNDKNKKALEEYNDIINKVGAILTELDTLI